MCGLDDEAEERPIARGFECPNAHTAKPVGKYWAVNLEDSFITKLSRHYQSLKEDITLLTRYVPIMREHTSVSNANICNELPL